METELKAMNPEPPKPDLPEPRRDDGSSKDDRPLLKSESGRISNENHHLEEMEKKFAAFVRNDVYGTMGRGELPLVEKVLLGIALVTLVPIRVMIAMSILLLYYVICRICTLFSAPNRDEVVEGEEQEDFAHMGGWRRAVIVLCGRFLSRLMLFVLGFYWINETYRDIQQPQPQPQSQSQSQSQPQDDKSSTQVCLYARATCFDYCS